MNQYLTKTLNFTYVEVTRMEQLDVIEDQCNVLVGEDDSRERTFYKEPCGGMVIDDSGGSNCDSFLNDGIKLYFYKRK